VNFLKKRRLSKEKFDVLKELANIGVGNALTSLSKMLNEEKVEMKVPEATLAPLQDIPDLLGGAEFPVAGIYIESHGDIGLTILFVLSLDSAYKLISTLMPDSQGELDEMGLSALLEVGNILTGSYLNALSMMTDSRMLPSPPKIAVDMSGAIISTVIAEARIVDDEVVILKTSMNSLQSNISGHILILPDRGSLKKIFTLLGVR
jgi:chemotaxis protein CheC